MTIVEPLDRGLFRYTDGCGGSTVMDLHPDQITAKNRPYWCPKCGQKFVRLKVKDENKNRTPIAGAG